MSLPYDAGLQKERSETYWTEGQGSVSYFAQNGSTDENTREYGVDPFGKRALLWKCTPNGESSGGDGGWNANNISIDNTYMYRFSCWYRRPVVGSGYAYLGTNGYGTTSGIYNYADTLDTNPYFWIASANSNYLGNGEWFLVVGHVYPNSYTLTNWKTHPETGAWKRDGTQLSYYTSSYPRDYKWHPTTTTTRTRSYLYYCGADTTTIQYMIYPRIDKCDGSEPEVSKLLRHGMTFKLTNLLLR